MQVIIVGSRKLRRRLTFAKDLECLNAWDSPKNENT